MKTLRNPKIGFLFAMLLLLLWPAIRYDFSTAAASDRESLSVRLDPQGPYLILASKAAARRFSAAIAIARTLHPQAQVITFRPEDLAETKRALLRRQPRYALAFLTPEELDVNFAWRWLTLTTQLDDDPFVDVRTGFITGATPQSAANFMRRIAAAVHGTVKLPGVLIDNLGPNTMANKQDFFKSPGSFFVPAAGKRFALFSISHGTEGFGPEQLHSLSGAGLIHLGGHGSPDRVDEGVTGRQARRLQLSPCVVFSGACYTGVTHRWYDQYSPTGQVIEHTVAADDSFCLNLLDNAAIAYLGALHPDHGIPVYQEMEYLAYSGASLGDVIKHTQDGVILASGGRLPVFEPLASGAPSPAWGPSEIMRKGTATRVLFGDPALILTPAFTPPPFAVTVTPEGDTLHITARLVNTDLKSAYTDTYYADLAQDKNLFNDRALITAKLPPGWEAVREITVRKVTAEGQAMPYRLVGSAVEREGGVRLLHIQVDVPTQGYMQSRFRVAGATVEMTALRASR